MFSIAGQKETIARLRDQIARIERDDGVPVHPVVPFGIAAIDDVLSGGLARGALHEVAGAGPDTEQGAAAAVFLAGLLARMDGPVLWVRPWPDLFAPVFPPGLAGAGLHPSRIVFADAGKDVLAVMEEGLGHPGLAAVVGELSGGLSLVASRRLQLASGQSGVMAALLRRARIFDDPALSAPSAAVTRWRITVLPSAPPVPHAPSVPGLGAALWRLDLTRHRGGLTGSWIVEACDATGRLTLAANLADGPDQAGERRYA
jgi:protein ImuA